jgi:hypothetical protein
MRLQGGFDRTDDALGADVEQRAGARIEQNEDVLHADVTVPRRQFTARSFVSTIGSNAPRRTGAVS